MQKALRQGFTLIEVMLVIVLMGILASVVVVNFVSEPKDKVLSRETERLQQLIHFASEQAILKHIDFGLVLDDDGYQFVVFDGTRWQAVPEPRAFAEHQWPDNLTVELQLDGLAFAEDSLMGQDEFQEQQEQMLKQLTDNALRSGEQNEKKRPLLPQVYILSSGEISPFLLVLSDQTEQVAWYQSLKGEYSTPLTRTEPDTVRP